MKILLIGANGQLGSDLSLALADSGHEVIPLTHADLDVTQPLAVTSLLETYRPDVVINTAAYHKVDEVEQNPERAFAVNAVAPFGLAQICRELNAILVFISSDYVFGGDLSRRTPYTECDLPAPLNVYGTSKLAGEHLIRSVWDRHYMIRTTGLYGVRGASGKGGNFVELMLRLARDGKAIRVVDDQRLTPTFTVDLARAIVTLLEGAPFGLYHVTNGGDCTWFEFAAQIFAHMGLKPDLSPTTSTEYKTLARRPSYSVLEKAALAHLGLPPMRVWQDALAEYLSLRSRS